MHLGNLEPTRDFNYVANTVDGFALAAASPDAIGRTINLGSGREISIRDLVGLIGQFLDRHIEIVTEHQRVRPPLSEVDRLLADGSLAKRLLGWKPAVSLEEGLRLTIDWFKKNVDRYGVESYVV